MITKEQIVELGDNQYLMDSKRVKEIEEAIAELKARWPAHSVPPKIWQQLEELEEKLELAKAE